MSNTTPGRQVVQIVELVQPLCANTFGVAPCTATGTNDEKCFNTRATCLDPDNFDGSSTLSLYFAKGYVAEQEVSGAPYIIPSLVSVSTIPTRINLSAADKDARGLGNRATCNITMMDHPHTDRRVDPYVDGRTYDPYARGTFWTKWLRRNLYRQNITINVYEGYEGEALGAMTKRQFVLAEVNGPDASGRVSIKGKDILAKIEDRKAQVPQASPGVLKSDIDASRTSIVVQNATTSDYPSSGTLRIGDELMTYSAVAGEDNVITFTVTDRGSDGTTAAEHDAESTVQRCVRYTDAAVDDIVEDLLTTWGGIDASLIDSAGTFNDESGRHLGPYSLTTIISEPVAVIDLISELQEQCGFLIWWDERDALIKMRAIRGVESLPDTLTDETHIVAESFSVWELPKNRISQSWIYFDLRQPVLSLDKSNFRAVEVVADLASENADQYGEASIRKYLSRWLDSSVLAFSTGFKIVRRYSTTPRRCRFRLDAKDRDYWVGDVVYLSHPDLVDAYGERDIVQWTIVSAEEVVPGHTVEYEAEDTEAYGKVYEYMGTGAGDYPGAATVGFNDAYYGDTDGLLSDGSLAATYG